MVEYTTSSTSSIDSPPLVIPDEGKAAGPSLVGVYPDGKLSDLAPPIDNSDGRPPFPIPWRRLRDFVCEPYIPSTAPHVSQGSPSCAEWALVLQAYRGGGACFDVFEGWLLACEGDGDSGTTMAPRPVVGKICDLLHLPPADRERARRAVENEAELFNTALMSLQGAAVPLFYGVFEVSSPPRNQGTDSGPRERRMLLSILEDCGTLATTEDETWSLSAMPDEDKAALRAVVAAVHARGVVHHDIAPRNILRRDDAADGQTSGAGLCLVDFGEATLGSADQIAREYQQLDTELNKQCWRVPV